MLIIQPYRISKDSQVFVFNVFAHTAMLYEKRSLKNVIISLAKSSKRTILASGTKAFLILESV